ncbi:DUF3027 domain-containing protein [Kineosporia babensis]|uniref:DUF3027 domain-containing protein n=1 Tax=Kineosporia babensis TaxID=499548 RepID=A0A9X1T0C7_9ACTN|nr:DUF3027 domain-containing protein [Kineosporia babensis]MCD5312583.1 DUF3027 domain-containing protein [Kineosporia babensis]
MTDQQVTGSVREVEAPAVPEQAPPVAARPTEPDPLAAAAVDLAREAAEEVAQPGTVGRHLSVSAEESGLTMHAFDCTAKGYRGWRWAVTLAHVPGSDRVTVCDTVLLPGAESIMAPDWVPWSDRLAPGDLGAGDELPYKLEDPNLVPGYTVTDEDDADQQLFWELGLGRERVLGREGVSGAADRWHRGPHGPTAEVAVQASASCVSCAYFIPLSGVMRQHFGACANEWSPADGSVVTADFGCGAHSETDLEMPAPEPLGEHILDETVVDRIDLAEADPTPGIETGSSLDEPAPAAGIEDVAGPASAEIGDVPGPVAADGSASTAIEDVSGPVDEAGSASGAGQVSAPRSMTAGGISSDVVSVEPSEPVAVEVEPSVDPEPVQSPEDVIIVRPLTEDAAEAPVEQPSSAAPEAAVGTQAVAPTEVAPDTPAAEEVPIEVAEAAPAGQFVQSQPEEEQTPPPALSSQAAQAQGDSEDSPGESTEAAQGRSVKAEGENIASLEVPEEKSVDSAAPGASVLESDGALGREPVNQDGELAGVDVAEAAQVQVGTDSSPTAAEPGAAEEAAVQTEVQIGEAGAGAGDEVPPERPRHTDLAIDSAEAAAEPEPVALPVVEQAAQQAGESQTQQVEGDPAQDGKPEGEKP